MSVALRIDIPRQKGRVRLGPICRDLVEHGHDDQPAEVWIDGVRCLTLRSIHAVALTDVSEEPFCRHVPYSPHPRAEIGPRMQALLIDRRLRKEYGA